MNQDNHVNSLNSDWKSLYTVGGIAALIAGIIFRRNLGVEISLFSPQKPPDTIVDWFSLLQNNRLLGLAYLNIFDLVNYILVGFMILALYAVLKQGNKSHMVIASALGFSGILIYFASNTALSMLSLSSQYAIATTEAQRTVLLAAGEAMQALTRFGNPGAHPGSGGYLSLLLIAAACMIASIVMLRSGVFTRASAYVGIAASALDLAYCLAYLFFPAADSDLLALFFIPAAGLFYMIWHVLIGLRLIQLSRRNGKMLPWQS